MAEPTPGLANGLSTTAEMALSMAKAALVAQLIADFDQGLLNQDRMGYLMGGTDGVKVIGPAIVEAILA